MNLSMPFCAMLVGVACTACGGSSPGGPSQTPTGRTTRVSVMCPEFGESSRCTAFAFFGEADGQDVTGLADWSTSNASVATAGSAGLVTVRTTGEVAIRASYDGVSGFAISWAVPGAGLHGTSRTLSGTVLGLNGPLPDVTMEILDGLNAGRRTTTGVNGGFFMDGLADGPFTIRLSKSGFQTAEYNWRIPGGSNRTPTLSQSR